MQQDLCDQFAYTKIPVFIMWHLDFMQHEIRSMNKLISLHKRAMDKQLKLRY